jgi:hypothetical protein
MPSEIRQKLIKDVSHMDFDEIDNLVGVALAMNHLYQLGIPQTVSALDKVLCGSISKPTIRDYRLWLFYSRVVEPPIGYEDPKSWSGRHLLFTVYLERLPPELEDTYASDRVLRKRFDKIHEKKIAKYDQNHNLQLNAHEILQQARKTIGEDVFLDGVMNFVRPHLPKNKQHAQLDRETFIKAIDGRVFETDFEKHRYPLRGLSFWSKIKAKPQPRFTKFVTSITQFVTRIRKLITNL